MTLQEIELVIYEQAARNYAAYLVRCQRRAEAANREVESVTAELNHMARKLEAAYCGAKVTANVSCYC